MVEHASGLQSRFSNRLLDAATNGGMAGLETRSTAKSSPYA
jgi:hypothetical protein